MRLNSVREEFLREAAASTINQREEEEEIANREASAAALNDGKIISGKRPNGVVGIGVTNDENVFDEVRTEDRRGEVTLRDSFWEINC